MDKDRIQVGQIVNTRGIKGEIKIYPLTDDPARFYDLETLWINHKDSFLNFEIQAVSIHKNMVFLKLKGIDDINEAEKYKNDYVLIDRKDAIPLEEDQYFIFDLIGCDVRTLEGQYVGKVTDVLQTAANDIYVVKDKDKEALIPAVAQFVKKVDIEEKCILIDPIEGLI